MVGNLTRHRLFIARVAALVSGTLLLGIAALVIATGLCLKSTRVSNMLVWLGGYPGCSYLHAELLPDFFIPLVVVHIAATAETLSAHLANEGEPYSLLGAIYRGFSWSLAIILLVLYIVAR